MLKTLLLSALLITGCTTYEEAVQVQGERAKQSCRIYGFVEGTAEFAQCTMQVAQSNQQAAQQASLGLITAGQQMRTQPVAVPPAMAVCTSQRFGNSVSTMCQ